MDSFGDKLEKERVISHLESLYFLFTNDLFLISTNQLFQVFSPDFSDSRGRKMFEETNDFGSLESRKQRFYFFFQMFRHERFPFNNQGQLFSQFFIRNGRNDKALVNYPFKLFLQRLRRIFDSSGNNDRIGPSQNAERSI